MLGYAVACLHMRPKDFWACTPLEFNAASESYLRQNMSAEDFAALSDGHPKREVGFTDQGEETDWTNDLVNNALALLEEHS